MQLNTTRALAVFAAAGLTLSLAACAGDAEADNTPAPDATAAASEVDAPDTEAEATSVSYPVTITNCGDDLEIESEPQTILTIGSSAISLLDAAGASDRIVARSGEFGADLPIDLTNPPADAEIIDPSDPTTEKIIGANADIVVGYGLWNSTDEDLAAAGMQNIIIDGECSHDGAVVDATGFDAIFADVERLGTIFNTEDVAAANVEALRAELAELESGVTSDAERSAAVLYYFCDVCTLSARGGLGIANDILSRANLSNVYADEDRVYLETSLETVLDADPEVIVIAYGLYGEDFESAKAVFLSEPGAEDLQAVQNDMVVGALANDLSPAPDALRGLRELLAGVS